MLPSFAKVCSQYCRTWTTLFGGKIPHTGSPGASGTPLHKRVAWRCRALPRRRFASTEAATLQQAAPCPFKKKLIVQWKRGKASSSYHSQWLAHHCRCHQCVDKSSGQKVRPASSFRDEYSIDEVRICGEEGVVRVRMAEAPEHVLQLPISFLYDNSYDDSDSDRRTLRRPSSRQSREPPPLVDPVPTMEYSDLVAGEDEPVHRWLALLAERGVVLLRGVPANQPGAVAVAAQLIAHLQQTLYGSTFDVVSQEDAINIAYTTAALEPHMDLVYYQSPPGLQFLHCWQFDACVAGGESTFVDGFAVARALRETHPEHFRLLTTVPATFQKIHYRRERPAHFVYRQPHISVTPEGEVSKIAWSPPFEGPLRTSPDLVEPYYRAYRRFAAMIKEPGRMVQFQLRPGDMVTFNNLRILHGRREFTLNGGARYLQGAYVNIDEFRSRLCYLSTKLGRPLTHYHIGNGDA